MSKKFILALDQGTTSSRAILFDHSGKSIANTQKDFKQIFPQPGWVEHDPKDIWNSQIQTALNITTNINTEFQDIAGIGITNQRETTIVWDKETGEPIYNAIVWQDRRTSKYCDSLKQKGHLDNIKQKTGLIIDAYFSATKLKWILDHVEGSREKAKQGRLCW